MDLTPRSTHPALLTTEEVAARLQLEPKTLTWWRSQKRGPAFLRLGSGLRAPIRYRPDAIEAYLSKMEANALDG